MEDNFRHRVDKTFGSLASSSSSSLQPPPNPNTLSSSSSLSSLWCLTDEEIERREWNRHRDSPDDVEPNPYPPNLDGFFANQRKLSPQFEPPDLRSELEASLEDLTDDEDDDDDNKSVKPDDHDEEEWKIRSSIGLDCTLDYEEEEDKYDKVATCREKAGDKLYMKDVNDYWTDINFYDELPNTFKEATRDPRANHLAAKLRLKEDAEAAGRFDSLQVSDTGPHAANTENNSLEGVVNLKSILKRKENQTDSKSQKRVRFGGDCKDVCEEGFEGAKDVEMDNCSTEEAKISEASFQVSSVVPDYIRNPSKYTYYAFDSSDNDNDVDDESNQKACVDFLKQLNRSNDEEPQPVDTSVDLPKSIAFTPKKKLGDALMLNKGDGLKQNREDVGKEFIPGKGYPISIAVVEAHGSEVCAMEEDDEPQEVATENSSLQRQGRQYRTKPNIGSDEPNT